MIYWGGGKKGGFEKFDTDVYALAFDSCVPVREPSHEVVRKAS